jgi:hypothetical protein
MNTTITWATQHVRGRQDEGDMPTVLTRFETLNCEMDRAAKEALQRFNGSKHLPLMKGTLWSLSIDQVRIVKNMHQRIYDHVHGKEAQAYWQQKGKLGVDPETINWHTIQLAKQRCKKNRQWFITKHASGMCGVGKFLAIWKEQNHSACPRCGRFEDAVHVWKCQSETSKEIWKSQLHALTDWLNSVITNLAISHAIILGLSSWYNPAHPHTIVDQQVQELYHLQEEIGWDGFLEGFHHIHWTTLQQQHYTSCNSRCSGQRWSIALIIQLWDIASLLWKDRNASQHLPQQVNDLESRVVNQRIWYLYNSLEGTTRQEDSDLFTWDINDLLSKGRTFKKEWLLQAERLLSYQLERTCRTRSLEPLSRRTISQGRRWGESEEVQQMAATLRRGLNPRPQEA